MGDRQEAAGGRRPPDHLHGRMGSCWQPYVKGITIMVNSSYNGYRYEDVWMDK
jgi:peptide/nickel transport system substrate-binding protein